MFRPLWARHARYKGAWGGRGSGKSHDRAAACVVALATGERVVGVREVQRSIRDSVRQLVEDKAGELGLDALFAPSTRDDLRTTTGGLMVFRGLQDHTAESIKSLEGFKYCWAEEAQSLSARSLQLLTPTIRAEESELWFTWNPARGSDPVEKLLRGPDVPENAVVVQANWQDNPFFPDALRADMERDKRIDPDLYAHVWLGDYQRVGEGAYYANELGKARIDGRITRLPIDPAAPIHTGWDIGWDDVTAIWAAQVIGREVHVIDFMEDRNQQPSVYVRWIRDNGYDTGTAYLPHDAGSKEKGSGRSYEDFVREAGLRRVRVLERASDVLADLQRVRSFLSRCYIDEVRCKDGLRALGAYRVDWDDKLRRPKQRPVHDWASDPADAFRSMACAFERGDMDITDPADAARSLNTGRIVRPPRRDEAPIYGYRRNL